MIIEFKDDLIIYNDITINVNNLDNNKLFTFLEFIVENEKLIEFKESNPVAVSKYLLEALRGTSGI